MKLIIYAFSKKVTSNIIKSIKIEDKLDIERIKSIINKLPTPKEKDLRNLNLRTNPKNWILSLLESFPNIDKNKMNQLLYDFTDSMRSRMRETNKYIIGIINQDQLLLCHSIYGEETITPEWKTIPRMLDSDNILRYVLFQKANQSIKVRYYEKYATESFVEWLRLPSRDAFYHFGGYFRFLSEIDKIIHVFELNENQIDEWINKHPEIKKGVIKLINPIESLIIKQIHVGNKKYGNIRDFLQDYHAQKYNIQFYRKQYIKIMETMEPFYIKFYDEKDKLIKIKDDETKIVLEKENPNFEILFVNNKIELRNSYLEDLYSRFINKEELNIFHAGVDFLAPPFSLANFKIWNKINQDELIKLILKYYMTINLQDKNLNRIIEIIIFKSLQKKNMLLPINKFFELMSNRIMEDFKLKNKITKLENEELNIQFEYKSRDWLPTKDNEIINKISDYLNKKLESKKAIILLIGVEDNGLIDPIPISRLKSDRISNLKKKIQKNLNKYFLFLPITCNREGIILIFVGNLK
ncbi:MAG: hypothetical protein ACTSVV_15170 [Promethearchaeota archaeon]